MSEWNRSREEYIQRYADDYCDGDVEGAKKHKIVMEVIREMEDKNDGKKSNRRN